MATTKTILSQIAKHPKELKLLVKSIRNIELALGDGIKKVYDSEIDVMQKLRRVSNIAN